jgi:hypothetical protein
MIQRPTRAWKLLALTAILVAAIALLAAADTTNAAVGPNTVGVPAQAFIPVGGNTTINVEGQAPTGDSLAVWAVRVTFDPTVVSFVDCTPMPSPAGYTSASECSLDDPPDDTTVGIVGGAVRNTDGQGLFGSQVLASIQFHAVGALDQCGDLTVVLSAFVNDTGDALTPTVISGQICVAAGTSRIWGDVDCSGSFTLNDGRKIVVKSFGGNPAKIDPTCPDIGATVSVGGVQRIWGDVDCSGSFTLNDGRKIVVKSFGGNPAKIDPTCPDIVLRGGSIGLAAPIRTGAMAAAGNRSHHQLALTQGRRGGKCLHRTAGVTISRVPNTAALSHALGDAYAWVIEVRFDPDIVSTSAELCDPLNTPPGAAERSAAMSWTRTATAKLTP